MGWTGGQYSLYRALLGTTLLIRLGALASESSSISAPISAIGMLAAMALALGYHDRIAAGVVLVCAVPAALLHGTGVGLGGAPAVAILAALLLAQLSTPPAPFGSWDARGRVDPAGDWSRPPWISDAVWILLALIAGIRLIDAIAGAANEPAFRAIGLLFDAGLVLGACYRPARPRAWMAFVLWQLACWTAYGDTGSPDAWVLTLTLILACEPAWWPGRSSSAVDGRGPSTSPDAARLYYDGDCGFCHRSVRFVLAEETNVPLEDRLRFAPIASDTFQEHIASRSDLDPAELPDSIVLELEDGRLLTRSSAALEIATRLGGLWRGLARGARLVPRPLLDLAYDGIARVRKRLFAAPKAACPILPPALRARFDL